MRSAMMCVILLLSEVFGFAQESAAVSAISETVATPAATRSEGAGFTLMPGDLVSVEVYGHTDLSTSVRIPGDGPAVFPLVGAVPGVVGMSADGLAMEIKRRLEADYLRTATVTVTLREHSRRLVYVLGSVLHPQAVEMLPMDRLTALKAISASGGFLEEANRSAITIVRDERGSGQPEIIPLSGDPSADVVLRPSDLVVVPRLDRIYVLGQVGRPGAVSMPGAGPLTVSKALSLAGGFDRYARESTVQLLRPGEPARTLDVEALLEGTEGVEDPPLKPGDTVFVPTRRF